MASVQVGVKAEPLESPFIRQSDVRRRPLNPKPASAGRKLVGLDIPKNFRGGFPQEAAGGQMGREGAREDETGPHACHVAEDGGLDERLDDPPDGPEREDHRGEPGHRQASAGRRLRGRGLAAQRVHLGRPEAVAGTAGLPGRSERQKTMPVSAGAGRSTMVTLCPV